MSHHLSRKSARRAPRTGAWARSKWTNLSAHDLGDTEIFKAMEKYGSKIEDPEQLTLIVQDPSKHFVCPLTKGDIAAALESVPGKYREGLLSVVMLSGSTGQARMAKSDFAYGRYLDGKIFLHPFPKAWVDMTYRRPLKPTEEIECARVGAQVRRIKKGTQVTYSRDAIRRFYLRDVLLHELGHHVDAHRSLTKTHKKSEGYADWFAQEFGYNRR